MPAGQPTKLDNDMIERARGYLTKGSDNYYKSDEDVVIPMVEGMALTLGVHRDTINAWEKVNKEFSDIMEQLRQVQASILGNGGLSNRFNPTISKLMLSSKHGYVEKTEIDNKVSGKLKTGNIDPTLAADFADYMRKKN